MIRTLALIVSASLAGPSTTGTLGVRRSGGASCPAATRSSAEQQRMRTLAADLRQAEATATEDPKAGTAALQTQLARARTDAIAIARDPDASKARLYASLALAANLVAAGQRDGAIALVDPLIAASTTEPPIKLYGPELVALVAERRTALARREPGTIEVACARGCQVVVEGVIMGCAGPGAPLRVQMPSGRWHVDVFAPDDVGHATSGEIDVGAGATAKLVLAPTAAIDERGPGRAHDHGTRKLPRWAGIVGVSVGVALMIVGGVLVGVDGKCPDLKTAARGPGACGRRLATDGIGYGLLGGGAAISIGFAIPLAIGERRSRRRSPR